MPYAVGDLLEIGAEQTWLNQTCRNQYFFEIESGTGSVSGQEILAAFDNWIASVICAIQSSSLTYIRYQLDNRTDGLSFDEFSPVGRSGDLGGAEGTSFQAYGYRLDRGSKLTRNGYKRFAGVIKEMVVQNQINTVPAAYANFLILNDLEAWTIDVTGAGGTANLVPVIASRPTAERPTYLYQYAVGVALQPRVTTQVSRKAGRGE